MIASTKALSSLDSEPVFGQAIARIQRDLGWESGVAHTALAQIAQAYGVYLDDVAKAVLGARSIKRGLGLGLRPVKFNHRP